MNATVDELTAWLDHQRWFGNKGVPISKLEVLERLQLPGSEAVEAEASVVQVSYVLGTPERYLVFLERGADGSFRDALEDPAVARAVLAFARRGGRVAVGTTETVKAEVIGDGAGTLDHLPPEPAVRALGVEQSNTSVVLGERVLLKIFRKLEAGLNPELEMGRFLALHDFRATPKLLAALTLGASAWLYVALRLGEGSWASPPADVPFGPLREVLPRWGTPGAWATIASLALVSGLLAVALREWLTWRRGVSDARGAYR